MLLCLYIVYIYISTYINTRTLFIFTYLYTTSNLVVTPAIWKNSQIGKLPQVSQGKWSTLNAEIYSCVQNHEVGCCKIYIYVIYIYIYSIHIRFQQILFDISLHTWHHEISKISKFWRPRKHHIYFLQWIFGHRFICRALQLPLLHRFPMPQLQLDGLRLCHSRWIWVSSSNLCWQRLIWVDWFKCFFFVVCHIQQPWTYPTYPSAI